MEYKAIRLYNNSIKKYQLNLIYNLIEHKKYFLLQVKNSHKITQITVKQHLMWYFIIFKITY